MQTLAITFEQQKKDDNYDILHVQYMNKDIKSQSQTHNHLVYQNRE